MDLYGCRGKHFRRKSKALRQKGGFVRMTDVKRQSRFFEQSAFTPITAITGKTVITSSPSFIASCSGETPSESSMLLKNSRFDTESETRPQISGPTEHPMSPPSASSANIAVPPRSKRSAASEMTPGQRRLTPSPQSAHPNSDSRGNGENTAVR